MRTPSSGLWCLPGSLTWTSSMSPLAAGLLWTCLPSSSRTTRRSRTRDLRPWGCGLVLTSLQHGGTCTRLGLALLVTVTCEDVPRHDQSLQLRYPCRVPPPRLFLRVERHQARVRLVTARPERRISSDSCAVFGLL